MFEALRWRLTAWYLLVFTLVFVVVGLVVFLWANHRFTNEVDSAIRGVSAAAEQRVAQHDNIAQSEDDVRRVLADANLSGSADVFIILVRPDGTIAADPSDVPLTGLPDTASIARAAQTGLDSRSYSIGGEDLKIRTVAVRRDGQLLGFVQAGKSVREKEASLETLVIVMAGGGLTGLLLATFGGVFVAGIAIRPVKRSYERQREFVADASHELRTPLAVIRVNAEAAALTKADDAVHDIAAEASYMTRLLDDLLLLAGSDREGIGLEIGRIDLADVAESAARAAERLANESGLEFKIDVRGPIWVDADPERCREVLLILLDNAIKYTPRGGSVALRAAAFANDAVVTVSDTGIGVAPEEIGRLFDRFYRVDKARSRAVGGAGLGLSIAREIVDAHGGSLKVTSQPGAGTTVTMRLPLAKAAAAADASGSVAGR